MLKGTTCQHKEQCLKMAAVYQDERERVAIYRYGPAPQTNQEGLDGTSENFLKIICHRY